MDCVSCGLPIDPDEPWWGVYAWDAFDLRPREAMALHEACYAAGEWIDAAWWEGDTLRTEHQRRLVRAPGAGMYVLGVNVETGEPVLVISTEEARARG